MSARITEEFPKWAPIRSRSGCIRVVRLAANIVGDVDHDGQGLLGLEASPGTGARRHRRVHGPTIAVRMGGDSGKHRNVHPAINGKTVRLTIDLMSSGTQTAAGGAGQECLRRQERVGRGADAHTGEVLAMANDNTFNA